MQLSIIDLAGDKVTLPHTLDVLRVDGVKDFEVVAQGGMPSLDQAKGEFVCFMRGGFLPEPGYFSQALKMLQNHPEVGLFCCSSVSAKGGSGLTQTAIHDSGWATHARHFRPLAWAAALRHGHLNLPTVMVRKRYLMAVMQYQAQLGGSADWFLFHALGFRHGVVYSPDILCRHSDEAAQGGLDDFFSVLRFLQSDFRDICELYILSGILFHRFGEFVPAAVKQAGELNFSPYFEKALRAYTYDPIERRKWLSTRLKNVARSIYRVFDTPRRILRRLERIERRLPVSKIDAKFL